MNLPNFLYGSCSYGLLWGNHTLYSWKILFCWNFGHLRRKFGHFLPKLTNLRVLTYNFQTQLWVFLTFGMEFLWILALSWEPIILYLVVRWIKWNENLFLYVIQLRGLRGLNIITWEWYIRLCWNLVKLKNMFFFLILWWYWKGFWR